MRFLVLAGLMLCATGSSSEAGVFTDDLSRCIVAKASDGDKIELARWMFAAMSKNPSLSDMTNISQRQRDDLNKKTAELFTRLVVVDCRPQAVAALKNEGPHALGEAGQVLGAAASRQLLSSPEADAELGKMADFGDKSAWEALMKDAGIKTESQ